MPEQTKRQQLESHLAARAGTDPEFRERLLSDPKRTIEAEIGLRFPEELSIAVHEERLDRLHVVLRIDLLTGADLLGDGPQTAESPGAPFWRRR